MEGINLEATPVISQGKTGTCWSFSASSFLESEIIRLTGLSIDLSEMYSVRNTYTAKAQNYVMRQGNARFDQGGLAHDTFNAIEQYGIVPQEVFTGITNGANSHNHRELAAVLSSMLDTYVDNVAGTLSPRWKAAIEGVLDVYLGERVTTFTYEGKEFTPESFLSYTQIVPDDYISLTSFSHQAFYDSFILNVPDNFSNGSFYNLPLDEFMSVLDHALANGYTAALDCDISEETFSSKYGVAVIPEESDNNALSLTNPVQEMTISQGYRQQEFENYNTTDDHLMHITGIVKDQSGVKYYSIKNSWGTGAERTTNGGYIYMSESYLRLKSISILIHKSALPKPTAKLLKI
jgi:bleomycin hydrolase